MTSTTSWTPKTARQVYASLIKVANDMLDQASPQGNAGTAGPQEVVDALDVIVDQLEQVQAAIPAEPTNPEAQPSPTGEPEPQPEPQPEEDPKLAKANARIAELEKAAETDRLEKVARQYAELFGEPKVQNAKYDEVLSSGKDSGYWGAKVEAISEYKQNAGESQYKPAKNFTTWIEPRTKVAKQGSNEIVRL